MCPFQPEPFHLGFNRGVPREARSALSTGAEGQGVQKWIRNVSYFREFIAALFAEPWQGLPKGFLSLSPLSFLHSPSHAQEDL